MSNPTDPRQEYNSTYIVQDRSNQEEMTRLQVLDRMVTTGMGGVLPEQPNLTIFGRVLDVGCGSGGWLIEVAKTYPSLSLLVGVDISSKMLDSARTQAEAQGVSDRVEFHHMDALRMLEFPTNYFHLVNLRFAVGWHRTWDWPKLLQEFGRVCKAGGVIRLTEGEMLAESTSSALLRLYDLLLGAFYQAGHLFAPESTGITGQLVRLLQQSGVQNVQTRAHTLEYRAGTAEGQLFYEDMKYLYRTVVPFLRKWTHLPEDYETIYQQALSEMQQPDFVTTWNLLTAWGTAPRKKEKVAPLQG